MSEFSDSAFFGPYRLVRTLEESRFGERYLALHVRRQSSHVVHRFGVCRDRAERRRYVDAFERLAALHHPHILRLEQFSFGSAGRPWAVTPYTGSHDGLLTLGQLLDLKGGRLGEFEVKRVLEQLLCAAAHAHSCGARHGELSLDEVVVDRSGRVLVEHYGLRAQLRRAGDDPATLASDETRAILAIGYRALTGLAIADGFVRPARVIRGLGRRWDALFEWGLDAGGGFETPAEAIEAADALRRSAPADAGTVQVVLRRIRRPVEQRGRTFGGGA